MQQRVEERGLGRYKFKVLQIQKVVIYMYLDCKRSKIGDGDLGLLVELGIEILSKVMGLY